MSSSSDSSSEEEEETPQQLEQPVAANNNSSSSSSESDSSSDDENDKDQKDEAKTEAKSEAKTTSKDDKSSDSSSSDSDDDSNKPTKSKNLFGSDSSSSSDDDDDTNVGTNLNQNSAGGTSNNDLFGDDGDDSSDDDDTVKDGVENSGNKDTKADSSSSSSEEEEEATKINVEIPKIATNLGEEIHFVRLPNFLSVEPKPFDQQYYQDEEEEDQNQVMDEEGHARLRLRVENTIRWRTVTDQTTGEERRESNARFIKYNDGSVMMQVGSELFDVTCMPLSDFSHLFIRQGTGLKGQAVFKQKLTFRPTRIHSLTHKKVMTRLQQRSTQNVNKVRLINTIEEDPEIARDKKWKEQEISLKQASQRKNMEARRKVKKVGAGGGGKRLSGSYLDTVGHRGNNIYSESDSDLSSDGDKKPKPSKSNQYTNLESSEESESEVDKDSTDEDSDSDDDGKKKQKKNNVLSSSSDSDSD